MPNIRLTLAYDGTGFHGWQIQPGQPTVQGVLTDLLRRLTQEQVTLYGAGRTDAGVHAWGQVAHFKTDSTLSPGELARALNALLPAEIRVRSAEEVAPDFHSRWLAQAKTYRYSIYRGPVVPPFRWRYVLHHPYPLNFEAMNEAARCFDGRHDFSSFAASSGSEEDDRDREMLRDIYSSEMLVVPAEPCEDARHSPPAAPARNARRMGLCRPWKILFLRHMVRKHRRHAPRSWARPPCPSGHPAPVSICATLRAPGQPFRRRGCAWFPSNILRLAIRSRAIRIRFASEYCPARARALGRPAYISSRMPIREFTRRRRNRSSVWWDPATGEVFARVDSTSPGELPRILDRSRRAQAAWAKQSLASRCALLRRLVDSFTPAALRSPGASRTDIASRASYKRFSPTCSSLLEAAGYYAQHAPRLLAEERVSHHNLAVKAKSGRLRWLMLGVIGIIAPWNYPFAIAVGQAIPALAAGNTVLLKPSELTPSCGQLILECFAAAGVPPDLLQLFQGAGSVAAALIDARPDKIIFTGSVATGRRVARGLRTAWVDSVRPGASAARTP